ncbi:MAG: chitobiase/beta-hexosaminidase C-terminal domain-containing protein [Muribaculaceae bacterium]|nr:chitobiase/beta-hexosaminidase C-terminal domain-containing protein [Muribaculaceae bacterium]
MRLHRNLSFRIILSLLVLLLWGTTAKAQYNPADPPEPGVVFTLTTHCVPENAAWSLSPKERHAFGSSVYVYTTGNPGFKFIQWEDEEGNVISTDREFTYTMPSRDVTLTARFVYDPDSPEEPSTPEFKTESEITFITNPIDAGYFYQQSQGSWRDSYSDEFEVGSTHDFQVYAHQNYRFVNWTRGGVVIGTDEVLNYTVPQGDHTLVANFEYDPTNPEEPGGQRPLRLLKVQSNPADGGYVHFYHDYYSVYDAMVEEGSTKTIYSEAHDYYTFVNWTDDLGNVVSEALEFDYIMPKRNVTLTANFSYHYDPANPEEPGTPNPDGSIADNMVMWPRFGMFDDTHVQILCETPGATIHYTLDGTNPTAASPVYTAPIYVSSNLLVKAIAYKEGMEDSPVVSYQVTAYKTSAPIFTFENRLLRMSSETPDAIIRYTTDFSDPNEESTVYTLPFEPEENCRIKAYASKAGLTDSPISIYVFRRAEHSIPAPTFSLNEDGKLVIIPAVNDGETRYTTDGTDPDATSTLYTEPLTLDGNFIVKAYTAHVNFYDSPIGEYVIDGYQVAIPTYEYKDLALTLATATSGATVRYTTDGSVPTEESPAYSEPLRLTEDSKVVARGFKANYEPSDTISYTFVYADHVAATPVLTYDPEALTITMACDTVNAEIRYTIAGDAPTAETGIKYEGPIAVVGNHTYTAKAFRSDLFESEPASVTVDDQKVPTPTASFANRVLTLSCSDAEAAIRYTVDGTEPTAESALYETPVALTEDCTVLFVAQRQYFNDSDIESYEFKKAEHQAATPVLTYDPEAMTITMACDTDNAEIRYTIDGVAPTAETGIKYEGPVAVLGNHTYTARAFRSDLFDSEIATVAVDDRKVPTPTASFAKKQLTLECADANAQIRYTLDGSAPTAASILYEGPVALTEDCTVLFFALRENYNDSDVATFEFKVADHKVATPFATHSLETMKVTMTCETTGASIRYTTDGTVPTESTGILYEAPIDVTGNVTFTVKAFHSDYFDSDHITYVVSDMKLPVPVATYGKRTLTLSCEEPTAEIRYTADGTAPTESSALYSAPIPLSADCTVRFIATKERYVSSDEGTFRFILAEWQESQPSVTKDFEGRQIRITQADALPVRVSIDGREQTLPTPAALDVTPDMKVIEAVAVAQDEDRYDSPALKDDIIFHAAPTLHYNGHTLMVEPSGSDAALENAKCHLFIDGSPVAGGADVINLDMDGFCEVMAIVKSDHAFAGDPAELRIDFFNTGRVAGVKNGRRLSEVFGTWGDSADSYDYLRLAGELSREDLDIVAALPQLTTLHIEAESLESADYNGIFAGSRIETIFSNNYPEGILAGMPRLTAVMWGRRDVAMPDGRLTEAANPNLLFWTPSFDLLPEDAFNTVEYTYEPGGVPTDPDGYGVFGHATAVHLQDGYPFQAHMQVKADFINFKKTFTLPTEIGNCGGWETIALPFTATGISHEREGEITPFAAWDGVTDPNAGSRPFWLYGSTEEGWAASDSIRAGIPYVISMPNNKDYVDSYNLNGEVTFYAADALLGTPESAPVATAWTNGATFIGTFMPVEEEGILSLNVNADEEMTLRGSAFVPEDVTLPFGAYVVAPGSPQALPIFPGGSGVELPIISDGGIMVETPAPGMIRVSSCRVCNVAIYTPEGATVRTLSLQAGESASVEGLSRGLYICAGVKVMVK